MADKDQKRIQNVEGDYYVDSACIGCGLCVGTIDACFAVGDDGQMFVHAQPKSEAERALCKEALANCPVEAIGDDGSA